jgi:hypothetical protein
MEAKKDIDKALVFSFFPIQNQQSKEHRVSLCCLESEAWRQIAIKLGGSSHYAPQAQEYNLQ